MKISLLQAKPIIISAILGVIFSFIAGSRLSYYFITLNGRYAPEPLIILFAFILARSSNLGLKAFFKIAGLVFLFLLVPFAIDLAYSHSLVDLYKHLRCFALLSFTYFLGLEIRRKLLTNFNSFRYFCVFSLSFSISSIVFGVLSLSIQSESFSQTLTMYGGARSIQPDLAPLTILISLLFLAFPLSPIKLFVALGLSSLASFVVFSYSNNRASLFVLFLICVVFSSILVLKRKCARFGESYALDQLRLVILISLAIVFIFFITPDSIIPFIARLASSLSPDQAFEGTYNVLYYRSDFLESQLNRLAADDNASRFDILLSIARFPHYFILPNGFAQDLSSQRISASAGYDIGFNDSGVAKAISILGIPYTVVISLYVLKSLRKASLGLSASFFSSRLRLVPFSLALVVLLYSLSNDLVVSTFFSSVHLSVLMLTILLVPASVPSRRFASKVAGASP